VTVSVLRDRTESESPVLILTRFETRTRFMKNVVNPQPFTHYPRVLEMLQVSKWRRSLELRVTVRDLGVYPDPYPCLPGSEVRQSKPCGLS
jgi:hypothetical protein